MVEVKLENHAKQMSTKTKFLLTSVITRNYVAVLLF